MEKRKRPLKDTPRYAITLKMGDTLIASTGSTLLQALHSLTKPVKITTKSIITVTHGEKQFSRGLTIPMANRLFYPAAQIYHAKNYALLLK